MRGCSSNIAQMLPISSEIQKLPRLSFSQIWFNSIFFLNEMFWENCDKKIRNLFRCSFFWFRVDLPRCGYNTLRPIPLVWVCVCDTFSPAWSLGTEYTTQGILFQHQMNMKKLNEKRTNKYYRHAWHFFLLNI